MDTIIGGETQVVDEAARVILPPSFAAATVIVETVSDSEVRIRKSSEPAEPCVDYSEERITELSDRDRDILLALLDNPPPPNAALIELFAKHRRRDV